MIPHTVLMQAAYQVNLTVTLQRINASCPSELDRSVLIFTGGDLSITGEWIHPLIIEQISGLRDSYYVRMIQLSNPITSPILKQVV